LARLDWCRDDEAEGRFADQKYLDQFPERFADVRISRHPGVNLAPWNLDNHTLWTGGDGSLLVDGRPLIFFHFHGLRRLAPFLWNTQTRESGAPLSRLVRSSIYAPYLAALEGAESTTASPRRWALDYCKEGIVIDRIFLLALTAYNHPFSSMTSAGTGCGRLMA